MIQTNLSHSSSETGIPGKSNSLTLSQAYHTLSFLPTYNYYLGTFSLPASQYHIKIFSGGQPEVHIKCLKNCNAKNMTISLQELTL